jgi:hypothetical protein
MQMFSTFLRALACCAVTVPMFAQAAPYTVRDFMADPKFSAPRLSPGGQYLAMTAPVNDRKRLVIIDIAANKILHPEAAGGTHAMVTPLEPHLVIRDSCQPPAK